MRLKEEQKVERKRSAVVSLAYSAVCTLQYNHRCTHHGIRLTYTVDCRELLFCFQVATEGPVLHCTWRVDAVSIEAVRRARATSSDTSSDPTRELSLLLVHQFSLLSVRLVYACAVSALSTLLFSTLASSVQCTARHCAELLELLLLCSL